MPVRKASAEWNGNLREGSGNVSTESGALNKERYSFTSRFEEGMTGSNPEELIGAAHAGCFSMAFANTVAKAGFNPKSVKTEAKVYLEKVGEGNGITRVELSTQAEIADIDEETFQRLADDAKQNCPVSKALGAIKISLNAKLVK